MKTKGMQPRENSLGPTAILVHLGLAACGIAGLLSGMLAGDYKKAEHLGFTLHSWIGMSGLLLIFLRAALGLVGPPDLRFANWVPCTRERLSSVRDDLVGLLGLHLPQRPTHAGVAGVVQTLGLLAFLSLAMSGGFLFFTIDPGHKSRGIVHAVKEFHEFGLFLMLAFLTMHVGAVIMHAASGRNPWRTMLFLKTKPPGRPPDDAPGGALRD